MLIALTFAGFLNGLTTVWMIAAFIGSFILWLKNGAEMVDFVYGFVLIAALLIVPVILLLSVVCWAFGIDGYQFYVFK